MRVDTKIVFQIERRRFTRRRPNDDIIIAPKWKDALKTRSNKRKNKTISQKNVPVRQPVYADASRRIVLYAI